MKTSQVRGLVWLRSVSPGVKPGAKADPPQGVRPHQAGRQGQARKLHSDLDAGIRTPASRYTVGQAVEDWLREGLDGRSERVIRHPEANDYAAAVRACGQGAAGASAPAGRTAAAGRGPVARPRACVLYLDRIAARRGERAPDVQEDHESGRARRAVGSPGAEDFVRQPHVRLRRTVEEIACLAGHSSSRTTEVVYRRELRPVITTGAEVMDKIFSGHRALTCRPLRGRIRLGWSR